MAGDVAQYVYISFKSATEFSALKKYFKIASTKNVIKILLCTDLYVALLKSLRTQ